MGRSNSGVSGDFAADRVDLLCNSDERLYDEGEKVWAFHRGKWYQAKVCVYVCVFTVCIRRKIHTLVYSCIF